MPLTAAVTLVFLNLRVHFVGSETSSTTFQFLAKFLELFAQASIGAIVFSYLRYLTIHDEAIPFGALFSGVQATKISYLWSLEFAGVVASGWFRWQRKLAFVTIIPLSIVLATGVGPSFAIALTPTLGAYTIGGFDVWMNATEDQLFPQEISVDTPIWNTSVDCTTNCIATGWQTALSVSLNDFSTDQPVDTMDNPSSTRMLSGYSYYSDTYRHSGYSRYSVASESIAASLANTSQIWYYPLPENAYEDLYLNFSVQSRQPYVYGSCNSHEWSFKGTTAYALDTSTALLQSDLLQRLWDEPGKDLLLLNNTNILYTDDQHSLWAVISDNQGYLYMCFVEAGYADSQVTFGENMAGIYGQYLHAPAELIPLSPAWVNQTLPPWETLTESGVGTGNLHTFLSASIAISLAQWPTQLTEPPASGYDKLVMAVDDSYSVWDPYGRDIVSGHYGTLHAGSESDTDGKYHMYVDVTTEGYGYQIDRPSKAIAIGVLTAYCVYVLVFIIITLSVHRVHSNTWDSIAELTTLAMLSTPSEKLRNTSAGIDTVELFKAPVNIRAVGGDHLEIVFEGDAGSAAAELVEENVEY